MVRKVWRVPSIDWLSFLYGFGAAGVVAGIVFGIITLVDTDRSISPVQMETPVTTLEIIPSNSRPSPQQQVSLTPILSGKAMVPPIYIVWTSDHGTGLPQGSVPFEKGASWTWKAPDFTVSMDIKAVVSDSANSVVRGRVVIHISTPSPPPQKGEP